MSVAQVWIVVGIPALVLGLSLFAQRSHWRSLAAYAVLALGFALVTVVDRASGAVFGGLLALFYAAGRGGVGDRRRDALTGIDAVPEVTRRIARDHAS